MVSAAPLLSIRCAEVNFNGDVSTPFYEAQAPSSPDSGIGTGSSTYSTPIKKIHGRKRGLISHSEISSGEFGVYGDVSSSRSEHSTGEVRRSGRLTEKKTPTSQINVNQGSSTNCLSSRRIDVVENGTRSEKTEISKACDVNSTRGKHSMVPENLANSKKADDGSTEGVLRRRITVRLPLIEKNERKEETVSAKNRKRKQRRSSLGTFMASGMTTGTKQIDLRIGSKRAPTEDMTTKIDVKRIVAALPGFMKCGSSAMPTLVEQPSIQEIEKTRRSMPEVVELSSKPIDLRRSTRSLVRTDRARAPRSSVSSSDVPDNSSLATPKDNNVGERRVSVRFGPKTDIVHSASYSDSDEDVTLASIRRRAKAPLHLPLQAPETPRARENVNICLPKFSTRVPSDASYPCRDEPLMIDEENIKDQSIVRPLPPLNLNKKRMKRRSQKRWAAMMNALYERRERERMKKAREGEEVLNNGKTPLEELTTIKSELEEHITKVMSLANRALELAVHEECKSVAGEIGELIAKFVSSKPNAVAVPSVPSVATCTEKKKPVKRKCVHPLQGQGTKKKVGTRKFRKVR